MAGDGYAEYRVADLTSLVIFGLSRGDPDQGYADVDYGLLTYPGTGQVYVFEGGVYRATLGAYAVGDVLRVGVDGGVVTYAVDTPHYCLKKNTNTIYTTVIRMPKPEIMTPAFAVPLFSTFKLYNPTATPRMLIVPPHTGTIAMHRLNITQGR